MYPKDYSVGVVKNELVFIRTYHLKIYKNRNILVWRNIRFQRVTVRQNEVQLFQKQYSRNDLIKEFKIENF